MLHPQVDDTLQPGWISPSAYSLLLRLQPAHFSADNAASPKTVTASSSVALTVLRVRSGDVLLLAALVLVLGASFVLLGAAITHLLGQ